MQTLLLTLQPHTAFGTPLLGDTLFGQLCWTLRHQLGNARLNALLQGYTDGKPFAVVSDALPLGHVARDVVEQAARFTAKPDDGVPEVLRQALHHAFLALAVLTAISSLTFWTLAPNDGESVSKGAEAPRGD